MRLTSVRYFKALLMDKLKAWLPKWDSTTASMDSYLAVEGQRRLKKKLKVKTSTKKVVALIDNTRRSLQAAWWLGD